MGYRIKATGEYLVTDFALREYFADKAKVRYPITSDWMETNGVEPVFEGPQATGGTVYQYSQFAGIEQIEGKWYTKYVLGPIFTDTSEATAAEQEAAYKARKDAEQATVVRADRNNRLAECDWTQVADAPVDKAIWASYRQELRDITKQVGFPWQVAWPNPPA